jgi:Na+/H+-dicarboxylate symporter/ABC-type amino acid transport substrate-binding protein
VSDASVAAAVQQPPARGWANPSVRILAGLLAGVAAGLFFGEPASVLQPLADMYIRAMQMTVLPYLVLTLIGGLGKLDPATVRRLGTRALLVLAVLLLLATAVIAAMPLAFPPLESAAFYSDALIEPKQHFAFSELFVPANPFHAMANAVVPALVLFSSAVGLALIRVPGKAPLLASLRALEQAVVGVTRFVLALTPVGVFAIAASVAGTMDPASFVRLEVYFAAFAVASLLMAFVVLPLAVSAVTPFGYREVVGMCKEALLTAFIANSAFIVLPMLVKQVKARLSEREMEAGDARATVDIVVPIAFVVPNAGKLLTLMFVPFAAWLSGEPLGAGSYLSLFGAGIPTYFAKAQVALPFLMDLLGVPHDLFQLYIPSSIVTGKFDSMVTVMSLLALALVTAAAVSGRLQLEARRIVPALTVMLASTAVAVVALRLVLGLVVDTGYHQDEVLRGMQLSRAVLPLTVLAAPPEAPAERLPTLQRVRSSGVLRVAYVAGRVPFAFVNARGDLAGLDVDLAERLARDLAAKRVEFVPADYRQMAELLAEGRVDIAMGLPYLPSLLAQAAYSVPYLDSTLGLVVRDELRDDFASAAALRARSPVTVGVLSDLPGIQQGLRDSLPGVTLRFVVMPSPADFMSGKAKDVDAFAMLAEAGAAWSLLYPAFSVVVPQPRPVAMPIGVAVRRGDHDLVGFINDWLVIQRASGELKAARDYWVLGHGALPHRPRWSILHDVLGWGRQADPAAPAGAPKR